MLSFRDRFFTQKVSNAMMSPLAIVSAGGGAGAGILVGGIAGPLGAIVGGIVGAFLGWTARVGLAIPKAPAKTRIDPFTLAEPWRRLIQDAVAARRQFNDAVRRTNPGPIHDRLAGIGQRIDDTIEEAWAAARGGHELADAYTRVNVKEAQRELDAINSSRTGADLSATTQATVNALEAQVATATRMYQMMTDTRDQLQLLNARLDETVARSIELSVGTYKPEAFSEVEGDVGSITDELEALRSALEDTSTVPLPTLPQQATVAPPAPSTMPATDPATGDDGTAQPQGR